MGEEVRNGEISGIFETVDDKASSWDEFWLGDRRRDWRERKDNGIEFDEDLSERELRAVMYRVVESRVRVPASADMAAGRKR